MLLCAVGSFATGNNLALVFTVASFGLVGYFMDKNGYPVAALVLGAVMGTMVEQNFVTSLIKSDGSETIVLPRNRVALFMANMENNDKPLVSWQAQTCNLVIRSPLSSS